MPDQYDEDHTIPTHSAKCDVAGCSYVAKVHAHDDEEAVYSLSVELSAHNKETHQIEVTPEEIKEAVRAKTHVISQE